MCLWGNKAEAVDKTGVEKDGPDADSDASTYEDDTPADDQDVVASDGHEYDYSFQRIDGNEGSETTSGGNGITGHDETSENLSATWVDNLAYSPGDIPGESVKTTTWGRIKSEFNK